LVSIADAIMWSLRRSQKDVIRMYEALSPLMCAATGGTMLNFGYWDDDHNTPVLAQNNMCRIISEIARLEDYSDDNDGSSSSSSSNDDDGSRIVLDLGSGLSGPARYWQHMHPNLRMLCINTSYRQLLHAAANCSPAAKQHITMANASATSIPLRENALDCIIALESSQHFKPFELFVSESRRILSDSGVLVLAVPVTISKHAQTTRLGILNFTWASEHYTLNYIRRSLCSAGFSIDVQEMIGSSVYVPLADYYITNRSQIKKAISGLGYPWYLEHVLAASMRHMRRAAKSGTIDYALLRCSIQER